MGSNIGEQIMSLFSNIKNLFEKKKVFYCIVWDGKTMSYLNLSQKEIDKKLLLNKELIITKKDEIS